MSGKDAAAGFAHTVPLMLDIDRVLGAIASGPPKHAADRHRHRPWKTTAGEGNPRPEAFDASLGIETT